MKTFVQLKCRRFKNWHWPEGFETLERIQWCSANDPMSKTEAAFKAGIQKGAYHKPKSRIRNFFASRKLQYFQSVTLSDHKMSDLWSIFTRLFSWTPKNLKCHSETSCRYFFTWITKLRKTFGFDIVRCFQIYGDHFWAYWRPYQGAASRRSCLLFWKSLHHL